MSYILEALKRSQQERELGGVPTLRSLPLAEPEPTSGTNPWLITALALALLAVIIALYTAYTARLLPSNPPVTALSRTSQAPADPTNPAPAPSPVPPSASPAPPPAAGMAGGQVNPAAPSIAAAPSAPPAPPAVANRDQGSEARGQDPILAPIIEPDLSEVPMVPLKPRPPALPTLPLTPSPAIGAVPADLRREVERFKQQLAHEDKTTHKARQESSMEAPSKSAAPLATAEPSPEPSLPIPTARADDLPPGLQAKLPPRRLTVHVYGSNRENRFVVINAQRITEGARSSEGLLVQEILPDGVALEFEGQRFFVHR
jgi:general secretion pathway protein B